MSSVGLGHVKNGSRSVSSRATVYSAAIIVFLQACSLVIFGHRRPGAILSESLQLVLGFICLLTSLQAFRRSGNIARNYWRWLSCTFCVWIVAQGLGVYIDFSNDGSLEQLDDLLFFLSVIPFGMLIFLDYDGDSNRLDRLHFLDFLQICVFWISVYLYFADSTRVVNLDPFVWTRDLAYDAMLTGSFLLRAFVANSPVVRAFFGRMAVFLVLSGLADSYAAGPTVTVAPGSWFDMVWSLLLCVPLVIAATWNQQELPNSYTPSRAHKILINELFPLLYPFASLVLLAQVARTRTVLASGIMLLTFVAVCARTLLIQRRLLHAQQELLYKAAHDPLTSLWNHGTILDLLAREIERHERSGETLGLMMIDVDHFKGVNDSYGHPIGDLVLQEVAFRLTSSVRGYDLVGRYGGEEFLVILPGCTHADLGISAERLRLAVADQAVESVKGPIHVTISIGLATASGSQSRQDCVGLLRAADGALYGAKRDGRNRVEHAPVAASID